MNHDNILSAVHRVSLASGTSKKTNKPYTLLTLHLVNGFEATYFVGDESFAFKDAVEQAKSNPDSFLGDANTPVEKENETN